MFETERLFTPTQLKNAVKLRDLADKKRLTMEYGNVTVKRVSNLSRADVDEIVDSMSILVETQRDPYVFRLQPSREIEQVYVNAGVF